MQTIYILNQSNLVSGTDLSSYITAQNLQLSRDFNPLWNMSTQVVSTRSTSNFPLIIIANDTDQINALGYHTLTNSGNPLGFVFARTSRNFGVSWQSVASHELLELLADPYVNLAAYGQVSSQTAFFDYEVCDPVENDLYLINGVQMSNFVLPTWFVPWTITPKPTRFDYLRRLRNAYTLTSGGYAVYTSATGSPQFISRRASRNAGEFNEFSRFHRRKRAN